MKDDQIHPFEAAQRQRRAIIRVVRMAFFILIVTVTMLTILRQSEAPNTGQSSITLAINWWIPLGFAIGLFGVAVLADFLTPNKKVSTISGVFLGTLAGLVATVALSLVIDLVVTTWVTERAEQEALRVHMGTIKLLLGISLCYLCISTVLQTQDDFRLVIPYVEFSKQIRGPRPLLIDSSALIDARIVELAATGIMNSPIVIPAAVVGELQTLADSSDRLKRSKGRRGLDVIGRLQRTAPDVTIDDTPPGVGAVDQTLVEMARRMPATIVTTDTGLSRVAQIQGVLVLNINDVAAAMRPTLTPGERATVRLVRPGEQPGQAVGYLEDGTMVVVEHSAELIGQDAPIEFAGSLQTSGGRLVFARLAGAPPSDHAGAADPSDGFIDESPAAAPAAIEPEVDGAGDGHGFDDRAGSPGPFPPKRARRDKANARNPRR